MLAEIIADNVTDVLKGVITEGTGTRAEIGRPAAGKTGTAQEWRDAWFIGYTPTLSAAVWMGNKAKPTPMLNINGNAHVAGGTIPAATWKLFMDEAMKDVPVTDFPVPLPLESTSTTASTLFPPSTDTIPYQFEDPSTTFDTTPSTTVPETTTTVPSRSTTTVTTRRCGLLLPIC